MSESLKMFSYYMMRDVDVSSRQREQYSRTSRDVNTERASPSLVETHSFFPIV